MHKFSARPVSCPSAHTTVTSWKLRDENFQDEHGKLAPSVLRQRQLDTDSFNTGSTTASSRRGVQDAWFGVALEQLAQMCGGLLAATPDPHASITSSAPYLRININVGDAIDFCDSVLAASMTAGVPEGSLGPDASSSSSPTFTGIAFQQGTLQPLRLRKDTFRGLRPEFDVINTSNLADHLGEYSSTTNSLSLSLCPRSDLFVQEAPQIVH